ncbi:DsbA family protein [Ancylobacter sp. A5.8]|uniref:DsbA family protein n=1 Tax=Ancylobacter gelatini TaxID=2919920 RepID=UPI001F4DC97D|nr:DsbA family protein [Ancylobacter gelatini]MCJ8142844.1 DsbA family protein [Ancylobacter gelatini]
MKMLTPPVGPEDHMQGPEDAPVTLVEYGDYECPYCGEMYPVIKALQQAMDDRLRFVFRNFPLTGAHPHAGHAAQFSEAAAAIGRFWEAHDLLYEHQDALDDASLASYAQALGIDPADLEAAFDGRFDARIRVDFSGGLRSGVNGTPSLFINGRRYDGAHEPEALLDALELAAAVAG